MSQESGEQQSGQCGCVQLLLFLGLVAGAIEGGLLGFQFGQRLLGWWGGLFGAAGGAVAGAVVGMLAVIPVVAITGLVLFGLQWLANRGKRPREES